MPYASYAAIESRLKSGGVVILDGGIGTELERRGVAMNADAWCGAATLENNAMLEQVHLDYIAAGAEIITANTYASSRLMLEPAGLGDRFETLNRTAVETAMRARDRSGTDVVVAGSLSHMAPIVAGSAAQDASRLPSDAAMADAFGELATLLKDAGCELILLELMYDPARIPLAFRAAAETGLPRWAGFGARAGDGDTVLSFDQRHDIPFREIASLVDGFDFAAAGVMHTAANVTAAALAVLRKVYDGPLTAYPDSGYFKMPSWQFDDIIPPAELADYARGWVDEGAQVLGGCCGLSPEHIAALAPMRV